MRLSECRNNVLGNQTFLKKLRVSPNFSEILTTLQDVFQKNIFLLLLLLQVISALAAVVSAIDVAVALERKATLGTPRMLAQSGQEFSSARRPA